MSEELTGQGNARDVAAKLSAAQEAEDFGWLMGDAHGRRIVYGMLTRAGIWRSSYNDSPLAMAFAEGRRNEGLTLLNTVMKHSKLEYQTMIAEACHD